MWSLEDIVVVITRQNEVSMQKEKESSAIQKTAFYSSPEKKKVNDFLAIFFRNWKVAGKQGRRWTR